MAELIHVSIDPRDRRELEETLSGVKNGVKRVAVVAANRTLITVRSRVTKAVARTSGLKQKDIRNRLKPRKANFDRPEASLAVSARPIPLLQYRARETATGVTARTGASQSEHPRAFIERMPSGHRGVFKRAEGEGGGLVARLPIKEQFGPSIREQFEGVPGRVETEMRAAGETFQKNLASQTDRLLNRRKSRSS